MRSKIFVVLGLVGAGFVASCAPINERQQNVLTIDPPNMPILDHWQMVMCGSSSNRTDGRCKIEPTRPQGPITFTRTCSQPNNFPFQGTCALSNFSGWQTNASEGELRNFNQLIPVLVGESNFLRRRNEDWRMDPNIETALRLRRALQHVGFYDPYVDVNSIPTSARGFNSVLDEYETKKRLFELSQNNDDDSGGNDNNDDEANCDPNAPPGSFGGCD